MLSSPLSRNLHCEYNAIIMSPENNAYVQVRGGKARMDRYLHIYDCSTVWAPACPVCTSSPCRTTGASSPSTPTSTYTARWAVSST